MEITGSEAYRELAPNVAGIFGQPWWLDALCGETWDAYVIQEKSDQLLIPFHRKKKGGIPYITMPPVSLFMGPFTGHAGEPIRQLPPARLDKLMQPVIENWKAYRKVAYQMDSYFTYWFPFKEAGYRVKPRTHYALTQLQTATPEYHSSIKRQIRKAEKQIEITETDSIDPFLELSKRTYERQQTDLPYDAGQLRQLFEQVTNHASGNILVGMLDGKPAGSVWLIWDHRTLYYFLSGMDPDLKDSGVMPLLMHTAIELAREKQLDFNFYGSEIPSIAQFFKRFQAEAHTSYLIQSRYW